MDAKYYKLPMQFDSIFEEEGKSMIKCSELQSIDQHIELLLTTCPGEHKFNKEFGCGIWDMDFERVVSRHQWETAFVGHINRAVSRFEPRLEGVSISITVDDIGKRDYTLQTTAIKKEVIVTIGAILLSTGEKCGFQYALYLGPLTIE